MKRCTNKSVGAIIERDGELLLIDRRNIPYGWAAIAGHIEGGQTSEEALLAEVSEEVNLKVLSHKLLIEEMVPWNNCRRSGGEGHYWRVFKVEAEGKVEIEEEEVKGFGWFLRAEVEHLELEPVWRYWFEKLGYIKSSQ